MVLFGSLGLMAQEGAKTCNKDAAKSCCASKKSTAAASTDTKVLSAAESLASTDENITKKVCAESGATSFYKKEVCEKSGKITYTEVKYDESTMQFVNVSPNDIGNADGGIVVKAVNTENAQMSDAPSKEANAKKACSKDAKGKCCEKAKATEGTQK